MYYCSEDVYISCFALDLHLTRSNHIGDDYIIFFDGDHQRLWC